MSLQIIPFRTSNDLLFQQARQIREVVFVQEQQVEEQDEFDEFEDESIHYLLMLNDKAIATARWRIIGEKTKLERFAMLKEYRNKGYGTLILNKVVEDSKKTGNDLYMHAQLKAIPFYTRVGFEKVGEMFSECDIDHYKMVMYAGK